MKCPRCNAEMKPEQIKSLSGDNQQFVCKSCGQKVLSRPSKGITGLPGPATDGVAG
jgi:transposase-like protein